MLKYTLCVLAFICIIQHVNGRPLQNPVKPSPIQEAVQRINPELDKITLRLKELKLEIHKSLLQSFTEVHEKISEFGREILEAINQLQLNISKITKTANESDVDIESCLFSQRTKIERVAMAANSKTTKTLEESQLQANNFTERANELVKEADDIDKNLNKIIGYCIRQNTLAWQQGKLTACLFNEASYVNKKVDELNDKKSFIDSERNAITNNIATNQNNLLKWISKLKEEFLKCISESELYLNNSKVPHVQIQGNADTSVLHKPSKEEFSLEESIETNKTLLVNLDQQIHTTKDQSGQLQGILERIRKVEFLIDWLKQLHQYEKMANADTSSFSNENEFASSSTGTSVSPYPMKFEQNKETELSEHNRRFLLYISF